MDSDWTFKIMIAYEDLPLAIQAMGISERVAFQFDAKVDVWPFELLDLRRVREHAISMAATADMIIIAARSGLELPRGVKRWIEKGLRQKGKNPGSLVALLDHDPNLSNKPPLRTYLERTAGQGNVEFFCNLDNRWLVDRANKRLTS